MDDLIREIQQRFNTLELSVRNLRKSAEDYANAEREYKILLRTEILKLRDEGVPVGIVDKICYGIPEVADLRFKRDVAEAVYKANMESINTQKLQIRVIDNQIQREWK